MWAQRPIMIPGGLHPRRRGAYGRGPDAYVLLLFVQLIQQIRNLENKPPVTLALMTGAARSHARAPRFRAHARPLSRARMRGSRARPAPQRAGRGRRRPPSRPCGRMRPDGAAAPCALPLFLGRSLPTPFRPPSICRFLLCSQRGHVFP